MDRKFAVYYRHPEGGYRYIMTVSLVSDRDLPAEGCLEEVFWKMQGENWSPNGEAFDMIVALGVKHTSMSVGDIAKDKETGKMWVVKGLGWKEISETDLPYYCHLDNYQFL